MQGDDAVNYNDASKFQRKGGMLGAEAQQTELSATLATLHTQAQEIRALAFQLFDRMAARSECEKGDTQDFGHTYIARAQEIRAIQREAIGLLNELSKYA